MFERIILTKINDHVYLMDEAHEATGYIVIGSKKVAVIDTMIGLEDSMAVVRTLTDLPVSVINTHGHCDHIYGNVYYDNAHLHKDDFALAKEHYAFPEFAEEIKKRNVTPPAFTEIKEGDTFDLGGLTLEIYELPGHTKGGVVVLLKEDRILFTGDGINRHLWMQLEESLPITELIKGLERISFIKGKADFIAHGHARGLEPISLFDDLLRGAREIVNGETKDDKLYIYHGDKTATQHEFAPGSVIVYKEQ